MLFPHGSAFYVYVSSKLPPRGNLWGSSVEPQAPRSVIGELVGVSESFLEALICDFSSHVS